MACARAWACAGAVACAPPGAGGGADSESAVVRPGVEVLLAGDLAPLRGRRVGLITNHTGVAQLFVGAPRDAGTATTIDLISKKGEYVGGAIAPVLATALFSTTGNSWPITAYAVTVSLISWLCVLRLKETYRQRLTTSTEVR